MFCYAPQTAPVPSNSTLQGMFEARKRVFVDLLRWDVPVLENRYELDQFDNPDATYLVLTNDIAEHRASVRLLRTDRDHILGQLFPLLCSEAIPSGAGIQEITRFCIEPTLPRIERREARNQLVTALVQHAMRFNITDYTAVANVAWYRQIVDFGWKCRTLGPCRQIDGQSLVALHIRIDSDTPSDLAATGIYSPHNFHLAGMGGLQ